jgi:APA family basic amino acid/polyamine antiporter
LLPINGAPNGWDAASRGIQFAQDNRVGAAAAEVIFGNWGTYLMAALIMVSTFGCNSGSILSGARIYYTMAKEGLFFKQAGKLNKHQVPSFALWAQAVWASILCLSGTYNDLLDYLTFVSLIFYVITVDGVFRLRQTEPDAERPYRVASFFPFIYTILGLFIAIVLLVEKPQNTCIGLFIVLLGIPFYFIAKKKSEWKKEL